MEKNKRRKPSAIPSITSLTLVMFLLSMLGISLVAFDTLINNLVEEANMDIYFNSTCSKTDIETFIAKTKSNPQIKKVVYISQEQGFKELLNDKSDADLMDLISPEILPRSVEVYLKADPNFNKIMSSQAIEIQKNPIVEDVVYQKNVINEISRNLRIVQYILLGLCIIFILISIGLIQTSTRMNIFAKRFIIKSMQLLGATNNFIIKPLIKRYFIHAIVAFFIAIILSTLVLFSINNLSPVPINWSIFLNKVHLTKVAITLAVILIFGILLAIICAWLSTRKYLRAKIENLY